LVKKYSLITFNEKNKPFNTVGGTLVKKRKSLPFNNNDDTNKTRKTPPRKDSKEEKIIKPLKVAVKQLNFKQPQNNEKNQVFTQAETNFRKMERLLKRTERIIELNTQTQN